MARLKTRPSNPAAKAKLERTHERAFLQTIEGCVAGVDEVGRGALAGPLVAAAVILGAEVPEGINDSKVLTAKRRRELMTELEATGTQFGIGVVSVNEINQRGLSWSLGIASRRALLALPRRPTAVLLDGNHNYLPKIYKSKVIVGGDACELCIAAASIVAKVYRDDLMTKLAPRYPHFKFHTNVGYGTPEHLAALDQHEPCREHRTSWKPFRQLKFKL